MDHTQLLNNLAIDVVDAYTLAFEVVNDLSVIFKELEKLALAGRSDDRLARTSAKAGYLFAEDRLKSIDHKIVRATEAHDAIKSKYFVRH